MTILWLMNIFAFVLVVVVVLLLVPWRKMLEKRFANNPELGIVYIETSEQVYAEHCKATHETSKGIFYRFKFQGQYWRAFAPFNLKWKWLHGRRMLRLPIGSDTFVEWGNDYPPDYGEHGSAKLLDDALTHAVGSQIIKSLWGSTLKATSILIMLLLVGGGIYLAYNFFLKPKNQETPAPVTTTTTGPGPGGPTAELNDGIYEVVYK